MKILKIQFQNINSLKGEHEIDFTAVPFTASSLFAITGPTGSGKSTLLDVIALALFNQVPRLGKISKNEILNKGAILTRNQKEAQARITYECKTGIFASEWSISTARTGNLRDYEMQIFDLATNKALDLKKSDVPAKNEELIGLNYDQFIKSVLLAQGEFAQFLKAKKDERGELLEKITGTGIYRQVGIKAFQKFKEVNAEIEDGQRESKMLRNDLLEEDELKSLKIALADQEKSSPPLEKKLEELEKKISLKQHIEDQKNQINQQTELEKAAKAELQIFEAENGVKLKQHEQVQNFAEDLRNWRVLDESCRELKNEISENLKRHEENKKNLGTCLEDIRKFIKTEADAEGVEDKLQEFSQKVIKLQNRREEKRSYYQNLQKQFKIEVREVPFQLNGDLDSSEAKLRELYNFSQNEIDRIQTGFPKLNFEETEAGKEQLKKTLQQARRAEQENLRIINLSADVENAQKEMDAISAETKELPKKIALDKSNAETLKERLEKLQLKRQNQVLQASLDEHRMQLQDGKPCPLCGALEHPHSEDVPEREDGLQEEIRKTETDLTELTTVITKNKTSFQHHNRRLEDLKKIAFDKREQVSAHKSAFEKEFSGLLPSDVKTWQEFIELVEEQVIALEKYEQESRKLKAIAAGLPLIKELKEVRVQGIKVKKELEALYSGNDINTDCLELQTSWTGFRHTQNSLEQLAAELRKKEQTRTGDLQEMEAGLLPKIKEADCKDLKHALQSLMPEHKYSELRKNRDHLKTEIEKIGAILETLKSQLEKLQQRDVERPVEELREDFEARKKELLEIRDHCEELRRKIRNHLDLELKIAAIEEGLSHRKAKVRRWELLNQLIGDATGKKFNDFAQDLSLSQLLRHANVRLRDLSDRYRIDKPLADEDDSLVAIDEHMGGQRRSVKTLSGGETFILSLSMALALSDLASKNVEINSLFIDEGFGTLDPETLDQTLDTLEKLQAESSKTIGIISHVDSLKERIATQIRLQRNGQGYSTLEIKH